MMIVECFFHRHTFDNPRSWHERRGVTSLLHKSKVLGFGKYGICIYAKCMYIYAYVYNAYVYIW